MRVPKPKPKPKAKRKIKPKAGKPRSAVRREEKSMLDMTADEARAHLLKAESYCPTPLPPYFKFDDLLAGVVKEVGTGTLEEVCTDPISKRPKWPAELEKVNYTLYNNKDGRHGWRPLQLIHPAIYVTLVNQMTEPSQWEIIRDRFRKFRNEAPNFECLGIPRQAAGGGKDVAASILNWWKGIEQRSLELSLDYNCMVHADIENCYGSIYTHSIAWAVHDRAVAKQNRNNKLGKTLIGNIIDKHIGHMTNGQTNGLPQGSVLMDLIAELVLGYADLQLSERLAKKGIDFRILRFRDDYRIFVKNAQEGEAILKELTEVLIGLGLKLSTSKTSTFHQVVGHALKAGKMAWFRGRQWDSDLQKRLLLIHAHARDFPNSRSIARPLETFFKRLEKTKRPRNPLALIGIATDIACISPAVFPQCMAIVSRALDCLATKHEKVRAIERVHAKVSQLPSTGYLEVWLQRISCKIDLSHPYGESLCQVVMGNPVELWNNAWIGRPGLKASIDPEMIVDRPALRKLKAVVASSEVALFAPSGDY